MTRVDLPYLARIKAKGREYWYFRRGKLWIRLPGQPGESAFLTAYQALLDTDSGTPAPKPLSGTMAALIDAYQKSPEWNGLKPATQRDYLKFLPVFRERYGERTVAGMDRAWVFKMRARFAAEVSPRTANKAVACLSLLMTWAVNYGWRKDNPALRPKRLPVTGAYRAWTDEEVERFLDGAPAHLALACLLGVGTGQRAADLVRMTWAAYRDGMIEVVQQKTGARVWIPVHGRLRDALDARRQEIETAPAPRRKKSRPAAVTILTALRGRPYTAGNLSHDVHDRCVTLGIDGAVVHGWRKTAMNYMAEAGCTASEIQSISGHVKLDMVAGYTRAADRKRLARAAVVKLERGGKR